MVTLEKLKEVLDYDPDTGIFTWKVQSGTRMKKGDIAGCGHSKGYKQVHFGYKMYLAHRLAWFYMTGRWPVQIDHINRIKTDNRWINLREVDSSQNNFNKGPYPKGTTRKNWKMSEEALARRPKTRGKYRVKSTKV